MLNAFMKKHFWQNHKVATLFVTAYLIIYTLLHQSGASLQILGAMFLLSPFLVVWMAYTILRHAEYNGRDLYEDEEWGYADKRKEDLGSF
jgi:sensor histidine kinase YesM